MFPTIFIVDAYFQTYAGHNAIYNGEVLAACVRRGITGHIVAAKCIQAGCGAGTLPVLSSPAQFPLAALVKRFRVLAFFWTAPYCNIRRFVELLIHLRPLVTEQNTALIMDTSPATLLGDCCFWGLMRASGHRATVVLVVHDRPGRWFYCFSWFASKLTCGQRFILGFQPESLLALHLSLSPIRDVEHLPLPQVRPMLNLPSGHNLSNRPKIVLSCVGLTKSAKGTDVMLRAVEILLNRRDGPSVSNLHFVIQIDKPEFARFADPASCEALASLSGHRQVEFVEGPIDNTAYVRLIQESDCLVLPYRARFYRYIQSGVFLEAVAANKALIVPSGTSMAKDCLEYSLGLVFSSENVESLADVMVAMTTGIDTWLLSVRASRSSLIAKHDMERYVDILSSGAPGQSAGG